MTMPAHIEEMTFDELGDLWLVVPCATHDGAGRTVRFRVCSRTLARCSPVFRTMLYGSFAESRPAAGDDAANWKITLEDEDALALEDLLYVMHGRYDDFSLDTRLPDSGSSGFIEALYDFMTVVDKYDCTGITRPWSQSWVSLLMEAPTMNRQLLRRIAWILYQLGDRAGYESVVRTMVIEFPPSGLGELEMFGDMDESRDDEVIAEAPGLEGAYCPLSSERPRHVWLTCVFGLPDSIISHRCSLINTLLGSVRHLEKAAFSGMSNCCAVRSAPHEEREACQERLRMAAIRHLLLCGFWPLPRDLKSVSLTPRELERLLAKVNATTVTSALPSTYSRPGLDDTMASQAMSVYAAASRLNSQVNGTPHVLAGPHVHCKASRGTEGGGSERQVGGGGVVVEAFEYTATFPEARHLEAQAMKTGLSLGLSEGGGVGHKTKGAIKSGRMLVPRSHHSQVASAGGAA